MLVYNYLAHGYEEFIYVVDDLDNASKVYEKNKKQVFFFDDFLGSNFFDIQKQSTSFENKLITFINRIQKSPNSLFIMTTREYILSDANNYYEKLDLNKIDIAKCTIDLSNYTELVRAKILYNHLAEANMPSAYIDVLIEDKNYEQIIKHPNFNPRVIEAFINQKIWNDISPENFMTTVIVFFDKPLSVWEKAFENLNPFARYTLLVLTTFGGLAHYQEWQIACKHFCKTTFDDLHIVYDDILWKKTVKILQDCFIKDEIHLSHSNTFHLIKLFNPSIMDFCVSVIRDNQETLFFLLKSVFYPEQLTSLYTDSKKRIKSSESEIIISEDKEPLIYNVASQDIIQRIRLGDYPSIIKRTVTKFCVKFINSFPKLFNSKHRDFIEKYYDYNELYDTNIHLSLRLELMRKTHWKNVSFNPKQILTYIAMHEHLTFQLWVDFAETILFIGLSSLFEEYSFRCSITNQLMNEIDFVDNTDELKSIVVEIDYLNDYIPNLYSELSDYISEKEAILSAEEENKDSNLEDPESNLITPIPIKIDSIYEMFTSLYDNQQYRY